MRVVMLTKPSPALTISQSDTNCTAQSLQYKNGKVRQSFDSLAPACVLRYKARLSSLDYKLLGNSLFKSMKYKEAIIKYELALKWRWR